MIDSLQEYVNKSEENQRERGYHRKLGLSQPVEDSSSSEEELPRLPAGFKQDRDLLLLDFDSTIEEIQSPQQQYIPSPRHALTMLPAGG